MTDAFGTALAFILRSDIEGGFSNDSRDPGGATCLGVTKAVWEEFTGKPATIEDIRALTPAKVSPLYAARYWNPLHCSDLPPALALVVFDFGVNGGVSRAAKYLQSLVGASQDGVVGPATLAKVQGFIASHGVSDAVRQYQQLRRTYYRSLKNYGVFGKGWMARVDKGETEALKLA